MKRNPLKSTVSLLLALGMLLAMLPIFASEANATALGDNHRLPAGVYEIASMTDRSSPLTFITLSDLETPIDPIDPVKPTEPTEPTEPTDPTDPSEPAEPTDPPDPTEPSEPTEPDKPVADPKFTDVKGTWYEEIVTTLAARGVINGYADGTFRGDKTITRAEFVTLIVRAFDIETQKGYSSPFIDVNGWAKEYIDAAASCGIVKGITNATFAPNDPITREQMMTIIYRVQLYCKLTLPKLVQVPTFQDQEKVSTWAKSAVNALISTGLICGDETNHLHPQGNTTRAECTTVLYRLLASINEQAAQN